MHSTNILITGGAGFIGSNLIRYALANRPDWRITNLDALTYAGNPANLAGLDADQEARYRFVKADICNKEAVVDLFEEERFDGVFHLAAESHVDRSILGPAAFVETNINGTFHLLDAGLKLWERAGRPDSFRFVHVSTDEVYGSLGSEGLFTETSPYDPSSPYSASKAASDHLVKAYARTYGFPAIVTNCSNNYGPYQLPEKLIPLMILNILEEKDLPVYGDGKNVRDWLYVLDHCEALVQVFENGVLGETYNIGGGVQLENIGIIHMLCDIMDEKLGRGTADTSRRLVRFVKDRPGHDRRYAVDASKIKRTIGWEPAHRFEDAIAMTIDWYLTHMDWVNSVRSGEYRKWIDDNYGGR